MNLQEIAGGQMSNQALQAKLQKQSKQIEQLETENRWLREQLANTMEKEGKPEHGRRAFFNGRK